MEPQTFTEFGDIRYQLQDGDVALFQGGGLIGRLDDFTHAELVKWLRDEQGNRTTCMLTGFRELQGARMVTLSSQVTKYPGVISIYRPQVDQPTARRAAELLARQSGKRYGWWIIATAVLWHCMGLRFLTRWRPDHISDTLPSPWRSSKVCSSAVVWAYRLAIGKYRSHLWPCPGRADWACYPQHIAEDSFFGGRPLFANLVHQSSREVQK